MSNRLRPPDLNYEPRPHRTPGVVVVPRALVVIHETILGPTETLDFACWPTVIYGAIVLAIAWSFHLAGITFVRAEDLPRRWRPKR